MVMVAGVVALLSHAGVVAASAVITLAAMVVALGFGAARDRGRRFDFGLLVPIVAALPLFGVFYAIGRLIFARFGQEVGGGLLLAIGGILAIASTVFALRDRKHARS